MRVLRVATGLALACALLGACTDSAADERREGDCAARLGLDGAVFDPLGRPPEGGGAGRPDTAEVLDCDGEPIAQVDVRRLPRRGEPDVLAVREGRYRGFYLREGAAPSPVPVPVPSTTPGQG